MKPFDDHYIVNTDIGAVSRLSVERSAVIPAVAQAPAFLHHLRGTAVGDAEAPVDLEKLGLV